MNETDQVNLYTQDGQVVCDYPNLDSKKKVKKQRLSALEYERRVTLPGRYNYIAKE